MAWTFYDSNGNSLQLTGSHTLASHTGTVDSAEIASGAIDLAHMSVNSIDSDQYVDASIDLAHMSVNSIDSDQYVDGSIDNIHLATGIDAVKLADGTVTNAELQYINSLSSNAQTQIGLKAPIAGPTFTGTATFATLSDGTIAITAWVDEDNMSSNSATLVPTQQSVKAYVDSNSSAAYSAQTFTEIVLFSHGGY